MLIIRMSDEDADHYFLGVKEKRSNLMFDLANLQQACGAGLDAHLSISMS